MVFATETLAAGINARPHHRDRGPLQTHRAGHRPLMGSEFLQMAGRAGRRGLDSRGYVVTVQSRFEGVREAGQLATSPADPLVSQFTPSYGMVLNLLQRHDLAKARDLVERLWSPSRWSRPCREEDMLTQLRLQLGQLQGVAGDIPWEDFEEYEKLRAGCGRSVGCADLQQQAEETLANEPPSRSSSPAPAPWSA